MRLGSVDAAECARQDLVRSRAKRSAIVFMWPLQAPLYAYRLFLDGQCGLSVEGFCIGACMKPGQVDRTSPLSITHRNHVSFDILDNQLAEQV